MLDFYQNFTVLKAHPTCLKTIPQPAKTCTLKKIENKWNFCDDMFRIGIWCIYLCLCILICLFSIHIYHLLQSAFLYGWLYETSKQNFFPSSSYFASFFCVHHNFHDYFIQSTSTNLSFCPINGSKERTEEEQKKNMKLFTPWTDIHNQTVRRNI